MLEKEIKTELFEGKEVKFRINRYEILINARDLYSVMNDEILIRTSGELCEEVFYFLKDSKFTKMDCFFEIDKYKTFSIWMSKECAVEFVRNYSSDLASWCDEMINKLMPISVAISESERVVREVPASTGNDSSSEKEYSNAELADLLGLTEVMLLSTLEDEGFIERKETYQQLFEIAPLPNDGFIQVLDYDGSEISFYLNEGNIMICISDLGSAFNKEITAWLHSEKTIKAGRAIEKDGDAPLFISGAEEEDGEMSNFKMWMSEEIALDLAYWLDPDFFIWCHGLIEPLSTISLSEDVKILANMRADNRFINNFFNLNKSNN